MLGAIPTTKLKSTSNFGGRACSSERGRAIGNHYRVVLFCTETLPAQHLVSLCCVFRCFIG